MISLLVFFTTYFFALSRTIYSCEWSAPLFRLKFDGICHHFQYHNYWYLVSTLLLQSTFLYDCSREALAAFLCFHMTTVAFSNSTGGSDVLYQFVFVAWDQVLALLHFSNVSFLFFIKIGLIEIGLCIMGATKIVRKYVHSDKAILFGQNLYIQLWREGERQLAMLSLHLPTSALDWRMSFLPRVIVQGYFFIESRSPLTSKTEKSNVITTVWKSCDIPLRFWCWTYHSLIMLRQLAIKVNLKSNLK